MDNRGGLESSIKGAPWLLFLILTWPAYATAQTGQSPSEAFLSQVSPAQAPPLQPSPSAQYFPVSKIQIQGNTLLPERELAGLVANLTGGKVTLEELQKGAAAVQQAYREAGYGGVIAFVPEQELKDGEVVIRVIEGKIATVQISDNERYDEANIRRSLPNLKEGKTPLVRAIDRDIQLTNENPAKEVRVTLAAGAKPGDINAKVKVIEEKPLRLLLGFDSSGTPSTSRFRTNIGIQHANMWNRDHIGTFQFQTSPTDPSEVNVVSAGYRVPFYNLAGALEGFVAHTSVHASGIATPAGPLGFAGSGDVAGFRAHRYLPRLGEYDHRVTLGWDWRHYNNTCSIGIFGSAGCGPAAADVTLMPLSIGYTGQVQGPRLSWGFNTMMSGNVGGSSEQQFSAARPWADKHYTVWRFFGFSNLSLPAGFGLAARAAAQYSPDALVPGEQLGIGGAGSALGGVISVRGYREREVVGDYGTFFNLEALGPDAATFVDLRGFHLRPLVFFDYGWVGNNNNARCMINDSSCSLAGVGGGLRLGYGKRFAARLDLGHALMDGNQKAAGTTRGHITVNFSF